MKQNSNNQTRSLRRAAAKIIVIATCTLGSLGAAATTASATPARDSSPGSAATPARHNAPGSVATPAAHGGH